jgi:copper(I)-binding protein
VPTTTTIEGGGSLFYNAGDAFVPELTGLKNKVLVGQSVTVTLSFAQAGDLTLQVPIESSTLPGPSPAPSESASATVSPSATAAP